MAVLSVIVHILLVIIALILIVSVLMQQGNTAGLGAISGGAETFLGKNKAKSFEGKLELITKASAAAFVILAIIKVAID